MKLEAIGLSAGYTGTNVLHEISVQVRSGEFVGLVGPNGCGKSTLLRALSRTLAFKQGSVSLDDAPIWSMTALQLARQLAFVPQQEPAAFDFTVSDVVHMGRYPYHSRQKTDIERDIVKVREAIADADITGLEERPITRLSGGEHRRVLLARALAQDTPLLLLDEPTAHLDVTHQAELLALVQRLVRSRGVGAIAALHELNHAAEYCDRLVLMRDGVVVCSGPPAEVVTSENLRTAYGARARIGRNPVTGRPMILSITSLRGVDSTATSHPVHLICGGGSGIHLLNLLVRNGYPVSAGVLNENDSDWETAVALGVEMAQEAPFSTISAKARQQASEMISRADTVVIAEVPFGPGNLANLEIAAEAQRAGKTVVLIDSGNMDGRDFTNGQATRLITGLLHGGARRHSSFEAWISAG